MAELFKEELPGQRWIRATNVGSVAIDPYGAVEVTGSTTSGNQVILQVQRPTADNIREVAINSYQSIPISGNGRVTLDYPAYVLYNTAATPANGESWGTETDAFTLKKDNSGFTIIGGNIGDGVTSRTRVVRDAESSWTITADSGGSLEVNDGDTVDISGGTAISTTIALVGDVRTATVNVDLQYDLVAGAGSIGGTEPIAITGSTFIFQAGTGITLTGIANGIDIAASTTYSFFISADTGTSQEITDGNTADFEGTTLGHDRTSVPTDFNPRIQDYWGIITQAVGTDKIQFAVDGSVMQGLVFTGSQKPSDTTGGHVDVVQPVNNTTTFLGQTKNALTWVTSTSNGIYVKSAASDNGSFEPYIDDLFTFRDDVATTLEVNYNETIDVSGGATIDVTISGTDIQFAVKDVFLFNTGDTGTGAYDFGACTGFEIPNHATNHDTLAATDGLIAVDLTVTDWSHGILKYRGGEEMGVVAMPIAQFTSPTDGYVPAYNATNDEFELVATGGSWIADADSGGTKTVSTGDTVDFAGTAGEIDTITSGTSPNFTITFSVGDHIMKQVAYTAVDSANYRGSITGTSPVRAQDHATANQIEAQAGYSMHLEEVAGGKLIWEGRQQYAKVNAGQKSGDGASVTCQLCDDRSGTTTSGSNITVYLLTGTEGNNLRGGEVVQVSLGIDGDWTTSAGYSPKIGAIRHWTGTKANIEAGWSVMDGTANSGPGTAIDMRDRFIKGADASKITAGTAITTGDAGGSATHTHTFTTTSETTGITVDDHPPHYHKVGSVAGWLGSGSGTLDNSNVCSSGPKVSGCGSDMTLTHTVNDSGHTHDGPTDAGTVDPLHHMMYIIERVD